jgi:autotransporter-associated beta strand protein
VAAGINAQGQPAPGYVVIHNPMVPYTQFVPTLKLENMLNPALNGYLAFSGDILSNSSKVLAVIENITILEPDSFSQPIVPFRPSRNLQLAATGGSMSVWAPITGPKGIVKSGASEVVLEETSRSTYRGRTLVLDGSLVTRVPNGPAVGRGNIRINGGSLVLAPRGSGVARPVLGIGAGTFGFQGGTIELRQGKRSQLAAEIAGRLVRGTAGTLLIAPSRGLQALGDTEALWVNRDLPPQLTDFHGIVAPFILGQQNDTARSGDFLQYDEERGFVRANLAKAGEGIRASATDIAVGAGQRLDLHALRLDSAAVRGDGTLALSAGGATGAAGLILNGGAVDARRLHLNADENVIYASRQGGRISAGIEGRGGLVVVGPGRLHLSASNAYSGPTTVNGSTLIVENIDGSATGTGRVKVSPDATVTGIGRIGGDLQVEGSVEPGLGTGVLSVGGNAFFVNESEITWELADLTDSKADAGVRWSLLDVRGNLVFQGANNQFQTLKLKFPKGKGPDSQQPFWQQPHQWVIARAGGALDATGIAIASPRYNAGQFLIKAIEHSVQLVFTPAAAH